MNLEQIRKLASELYDSVYIEREDVPFYRQIAVRYAAGKILECGCGTGRVTIPLAEAGYPVDGLDISLPRLQVLRSRLQTLPGAVSGRVTCYEGDMKDFSLEENYALILTPFRTFQHLLTPADQRKALKNLWHSLRPGGRLLIDIFNPSIPRLADPVYLKPFGDDRYHSMPDGRLATFKQRIIARDYAAQTQEAEEIYEIYDPEGHFQETHRWAYTTRFTFRYELEYLLLTENFEVEEIWGGYDFCEFGARYPGEILILARRPQPVPPI